MCTTASYLLAIFPRRYSLKRFPLFHFKSEKLLFIASSTRFLSSVTRVGGFSNYEEEKLSRKLVVPEKFNFATDVVDKWAQRERDGLRSTSVPALWYVTDDGKERKLNFQEMEHETKKIASILKQHCGFQSGDCCIILLPKIPEFWLINIAAIRLGVVFSPVNMMMTVKDLAYRFNALRPSSVIAHVSVSDIVDEAVKSFPLLKNKILVSDKPHRKTDWIDLNNMKPETLEHQCASTSINDSMMIYFTSGTTGHPKMAEHTHGSFGLGVKDYGKYCLDLTSETLLWSMADTGWVFAAYNFLGAWHQGSGLFIHQMPRYSSKQTLEVLAKYPIDTLAAAPLVYKSLLEEDLEANKFKKLEYCMSGGDTQSVELADKWYARTGLRIYNGYGASETTGIMSSRKCFEYRSGSMGKPLPGAYVAIVDENENAVGPNITGEIALDRSKTLGVFKGYKGNKEATDAVLTEKYYHTGDMAYFDDDGYFWFVGRKDDIINSSGYRIGPSEVEDALLEHPAVKEAAAIGSRDVDRGEIVKAFVVLNSSLEPSTQLIKELQDHCKRTTAPYKYPRKIEFVKDLPRGPSGKVKRSELKKREQKNM